MNGLLNIIPVVGWFIAAVICFFMSVPIYYLWNSLAPIYFYWLPKVYMSIPFWDVFGLIWLLSSLRDLLLPSISASSSIKSES
jgi:hypothetical protein